MAAADRLMRRVRLHAAAAAAALGAALATPAPAAVIVVETIVDTAGGPSCSLRDAIVAANRDEAKGGCPAGSGDDVIDMASLSGTMEVFFTLPTIGSPSGTTLLRGPGADRLAISGLDAYAVLATGDAGGAPTQVVIEAVTIRDGAPYCILGEGQLTLRDSRVTSCTGGGLDTGEFGYGTRVERCLLDANEGAAIRVGGTAGSGGVLLVDSTLSGNHAGIVLTHAEGPGGVSQVYASTIADSKIANVQVGLDQRLSLDHAILKHYPGVPRQEVPGVNCVLDGVNLLPPGTPNLTSFASLSDDGSCALIGQGDLEGVDPLLGPLADNGGPTATRALLPGSPAIDAGESACPGPDGDLFVDQRGPGFPRPLPGAPGLPTRCDLGAFEVPEPDASAAWAALAALASAACGRSRRRGARAAVTLLAACAIAAAWPVRAEVVSRTLSTGSMSSVPVPATSLDFALSIGGALDDDGVPSEPPVLTLGGPVGVADDGAVFRADASVPGFADAAALLTNGAPDLIWISLLANNGNGNGDSGNEANFLLPLGHPGPDFAGATIEAIEVVIDAFDAGFTGEGALPTYWQVTYTTRVYLPEAGGATVAVGVLLALATTRRR